MLVFHNITILLQYNIKRIFNYITNNLNRTKNLNRNLDCTLINF